MTPTEPTLFFDLGFPYAYLAVERAAMRAATWAKRQRRVRWLAPAVHRRRLRAVPTPLSRGELFYGDDRLADAVAHRRR